MNPEDEDYKKVKIYSAIMVWLTECYEFILNAGSQHNAELILRATQMIGNKTLDLCLSHAVEHDELIPRFRFSEPESFNIKEMIVTLTRIGDSETLRNSIPEAAGLLSLVALDLLRGERVKETTTERYDLSQTLKELQ